MFNMHVRQTSSCDDCGERHCLCTLPTKHTGVVGSHQRMDDIHDMHMVYVGEVFFSDN